MKCEFLLTRCHRYIMNTRVFGKRNIKVGEPQSKRALSMQSLLLV